MKRGRKPKLFPLQMSDDASWDEIIFEIIYATMLMIALGLLRG